MFKSRRKLGMLCGAVAVLIGLVWMAVLSPDTSAEARVDRHLIQAGFAVLLAGSGCLTILASFWKPR